MAPLFLALGWRLIRTPSACLYNWSLSLVQKYDQELFKMAMPCLSAIAGALPPDYVDASLSTTLEKQTSVDAHGNFDPRPISTAK